MKTNDEILEKITCCTITEDADLDVKENFYYAYEDVIKAMNEVRKQANDAQSKDGKLPIPQVTVSLPSDKVIEDWYTKDLDSLNVRFWEEAPYCTHGDRVEEIKDAVHYFMTGNDGNWRKIGEGLILNIKIKQNEKTKVEPVNY